MSDAGLDPVVKKAIEITLGQVNPEMFHPNDYERWMCLFPALIAAGYRWDINDIDQWLKEHWPGLPNKDGMKHRNAQMVSAWADMALHQSRPSDWTSWAEDIILLARAESMG